MSVQMGLPSHVVFYVTSSFLSGKVIYIIATRKKLPAILSLLALFERRLEDKNREILMSPMPQFDWVECQPVPVLEINFIILNIVFAP
jgi:hypothetical protein